MLIGVAYVEQEVLSFNMLFDLLCFELLPLNGVDLFVFWLVADLVICVFACVCVFVCLFVFVGVFV